MCVAIKRHGFGHRRAGVANLCGPTILFFVHPTYDGPESTSSHRDNPLEYAAIFRRLPVALAIVDHELVVLDASEAYALLARTSLGDVVGQPLGVAFDGTDTSAVGSAVRTGIEIDATGVLADGPIRVRMAGIDAGSNGHSRALVVVTPANDPEAASALAEIQDAVRTIRHEINNPLTGALGNINLLLRQANLDEKTRKRLTTAEQEIKKVSLIVMKLADLAPRAPSASTDS